MSPKKIRKLAKLLKQLSDEQTQNETKYNVYPRTMDENRRLIPGQINELFCYSNSAYAGSGGGCLYVSNERFVRKSPDTRYQKRIGWKVIAIPVEQITR